VRHATVPISGTSERASVAARSDVFLTSR
jgi:hypothetical protein